MTLTLEISPELEEALRATAERAGLAPDRYVLDVLQERLDRDRDLPPRLPRSEAKLLQRINEGLPESTWERYHALKEKRDAETLTDAVSWSSRPFVFYRNLLQSQEPERRLYLAIRDTTFRGIFSEPVGQLGAGPLLIPLLIFVPEEEVIEQWIEPKSMPPSFGA